MRDRGATASQTTKPLERRVTASEFVLLVLRIAMEGAVVAALTYWGVQTGDSLGAKLLLGIGAPILGFGFWGAVDFHQAGRFAEPLRLVQVLAVSLLAAVAVYDAGQRVLGVALATLTIAYHVLVYASGGRLLNATEPGQPFAARRSA